MFSKLSLTYKMSDYQNSLLGEESPIHRQQFLSDPLYICFA